MKTVIIDFDGTLADSFDEVLAFLLTQTRRPLPAGEHAELRGLSMQALALAVGVPRWRLPLVFFRGRSVLRRRMHAVPLFDGWRDVLEDLRASGCQLYIMSSNSRLNIRRFLRRQGLTDYFSRVYGSAGWFGKGRTLTRILRDRHLAPANVVYVGDETRDIVGAHAAGVAAIGVTWGFGNRTKLAEHHPLAIVDTQKQLTEALQAWQKNL